MNKKLLKKYLNEDELKRITEKIREIEKTTAGEIVVSLKEKRNFGERSKSIQELAEKEFIKAGITKTKGSTGILIFIILTSRQFYILGDKKINDKIESFIWDNIVKIMSKNFTTGNFCDGVIAGLDECGKILSTHFPIKPDDVNELPDDVRIS